MDDISRYIAQFPREVQEKLRTLQSAIREVVPDATEKISYGIPTFYKGKNIVHYAAFRNHIGFYALPSTNGAFADELAGYKTGKGSVQFPIGEDLPVELIKKLVQYRIRELEKI